MPKSDAVLLSEIEKRAKRRGDRPTLRLIKAIKEADKKHKNHLHAGEGPPKVGDDIYVPTRMYIDHGEDDVDGGLAEVTEVSPGMSAGKQMPFICVKEHPSSSYNWDSLREQQAALKKEFGKRRAVVNPDYG